MVLYRLHLLPVCLIINGWNRQCHWIKWPVLPATIEGVVGGLKPVTVGTRFRLSESVMPLCRVTLDEFMHLRSCI